MTESTSVSPRNFLGGSGGGPFHFDFRAPPSTTMSVKENRCRKFQGNIFHQSKCQNCFQPRESHLLNDEDLSQVSTWILDCTFSYGKEKKNGHSDWKHPQMAKVLALSTREEMQIVKRKRFKSSQSRGTDST